MPCTLHSEYAETFPPIHKLKVSATVSELDKRQIKSQLPKKMSVGSVWLVPCKTSQVWQTHKSAMGHFEQNLSKIWTVLSTEGQVVKAQFSDALSVWGNWRDALKVYHCKIPQQNQLENEESHKLLASAWQKQKITYQDKTCTGSTEEKGLSKGP